MPHPHPLNILEIYNTLHSSNHCFYQHFWVNKILRATILIHMYVKTFSSLCAPLLSFIKHNISLGYIISILFVNCLAKALEKYLQNFLFYSGKYCVKNVKALFHVLHLKYFHHDVFVIQHLFTYNCWKLYIKTRIRKVKIK